SGTDSYTYLYDGNGNVGQLVNSSTGLPEAHYEYDPYGNEVLSTGALASSDNEGNEQNSSSSFQVISPSTQIVLPD
ncbi:MAG: hypothetical protein K8S27_05410, partial [Candidatus Omnitrophica bacterium]|nr:hypothetical protein [Candidatus Omnitrophota bacterium]